MSDFIKQVAKIQRELKAPKNQFNSFGKYKYRSCEDILEGLKPLLGELVLTIGDDVVLVGERVYVKATVTLTNGADSISNTALARESLTKKGMDDSQITGTASSYARKYALNGLFCIDDTKDADTMDNSPQSKPKAQAKVMPQATINPTQIVALRTLFHPGMTEQSFLQQWKIPKIEDVQLSSLDSVSNWLIQSKVK